MTKTRISVLENGLTVITVKQPTKSVMAGAFVNIGARSETLEENGLTHFLEHSLFKSSANRSTKEISLQIEQIGAEINAFTGRELTGYYVTGLTEHTETALDILSDVIQNPMFNLDEIEREKDVVVQEISIDLDDIESDTMNLLLLTAYPNQAMGRPILGNEEKVRSFSPVMLRNYMATHYITDNMVVIAVGDIKHKKFIKQVEKRFTSIPNNDRVEPHKAEYVGGFVQKIDTTYEQAHVGIAFKAPGSLKSKPYEILALILGAGMASPLFQEIRERLGLCYDVGATLIRSHDESLFVLYGATTNEHVSDFVSGVCKELVKVSQNISDLDMERIRNQMMRSIVLENENRMRSGMRAVSDHFNFKRIRSEEEIIIEIMKITKEDVMDAAKEILSLKNQPTLVVNGNAPQKNYKSIVMKTLKGEDA